MKSVKTALRSGTSHCLHIGFRSRPSAAACEPGTDHTRRRTQQTWDGGSGTAIALPETAS